MNKPTEIDGRKVLYYVETPDELLDDYIAITGNDNSNRVDIYSRLGDGEWEARTDFYSHFFAKLFLEERAKVEKLLGNRKEYEAVTKVYQQEEGPE